MNRVVGRLSRTRCVSLCFRRLGLGGSPHPPARPPGPHTLHELPQPLAHGPSGGFGRAEELRHNFRNCSVQSTQKPSAKAIAATITPTIKSGTPVRPSPIIVVFSVP